MDTIIWTFRWVFWMLIVSKRVLTPSEDLSTQDIFVSAPFIAIGVVSLFLPIVLIANPAFEVGVIFGICCYLIDGLLFYFVHDKFHSQESKWKNWKFRGPW